MTTLTALTDDTRGISWTDWLERNRLQDLRGVALRAKLTECAAMAASLLALAFWGHAADYQVWLGLILCAGAVRIAFLAGTVRRYDWVCLFVGMALLYNPVFLAFSLTGRVAFLLVIASIVPFAASLFLLKPRLTPSVAGY